MAREDLLANTFVELADVRLNDIDLTRITRLLPRRCCELFSWVTAAGLLLSDASGRLGVSGSSSDEMKSVELVEITTNEGPCLDCYRTARPVAATALIEALGRWPTFAPAALEAGFVSVQAVPIHVREQVIGALNLFSADVGPVDEADLLAAHALAQATAFAILRQRPAAPRPTTVPIPAVPDDPATLGTNDEQVIVEQAKGVLAGQAGIRVDEASFRLLRYAHHHHLQLIGVCRDVVAGSLKLATFPETSLQGRRRHRA